MLSELNSIRLCMNKIYKTGRIFFQQQQKNYVPEERRKQKKTQTGWLVLNLGRIVFRYICVCWFSSSNHCRVAMWKFIFILFYTLYHYVIFVVLCKEHLCFFGKNRAGNYFFGCCSYLILKWLLLF